MTMDMVGSQILVAKLQVRRPGTRKYPLKEKKIQPGILHSMTMPSKNQGRMRNFLIQKQEEFISSRHTLQKVQKEVHEAKSDNMREQI